MVPLSTLSCGHNVYVSAESFKHCSCCVRTPLVGFLGLITSVSFRTRDVGLDCFFRRLLYLFHDVERGLGSIRFVRMGWGGMAESRWAGTLSDVKITHFLGSIFFLACTMKNPKRAAFITPTA